MKLRKGDRVRVLQGKNRGDEGEVTKVIPKDDKVFVTGGRRPINVAKRHQRPTRATMQGGIIDKEMPLPVANVALVCRACGKPTRIGYRFDEAGRKLRVCKKCGADV